MAIVDTIIAGHMKTGCTEMGGLFLRWENLWIL